MAEEQDSSQDRSEEPTEKRLRDAREEGQVPRSKELTTMLLLLVGSGSLFASASLIGGNMGSVMRFNFTLEREAMFDPSLMLQHLGVSLVEATTSLIPFFIAMMLVSLLSPLALGGWLLSAKALMPKFSRMDPIKGLKRMFSAKSLVELVKSIAKVAVVATVSIFVLLSYQEDFLGMGKEAIPQAIAHGLSVLGWSVMGMSASLVLIAIIDIPFQIWDHRKQLMMTKQEVKDEYKNTEGKPEVKGRIRQLQREMAERRMMADVPKADVVITNPTHFAVAVKYDASKAEAPYVLAKGVEEVAFKIREIAEAHDVTVIEAPTLARAIYFTTRISQQIPAGLYVAVAQVLAYVFQLRRYRDGVGDKPQMRPEFPVPGELQRDTEGNPVDREQD
ncbi:flagellar biosynthesis protein FlhB [Aestuariirhabdus litorea]|uniref:Flagellar biosynthetic protein FlhB n=1 Tax=Aestuariirhabdus litorea TaxID=2528527 RepID=A0A3P3VRA1_9GAMM|nr:flagellar biosynthesis protein FlhB [Aestuariirhabdus litorea]RRJ84984.1 flagellar type III secretion system protein FlhB [Aestuariirhabdus litorea]RWW98209.1 flagellar type III secretion system protein FlhB [Endozoicomonadaceae bacterium GTF-13]